MKEIILGLIAKLPNKYFIEFFLKKFWKVDHIDYAFIVHSRDYRDFFKKYPGIKFLPKIFIKLILRYLWPMPICTIDGLEDINGTRLIGAFIGTPAYAEYLLKHKRIAEKKIYNSVKLAITFGAKYIGLGALSASLTANGLKLRDLQNKFEKVVITTGHSYTCWTITRNVYSLVKIIKRNIHDLILAIVGAAGSIGNSCFNILKDDFKKIILIDKIYNNSIIENKKNNLIIYSNNLSVLKEADVIITATNSPYAIISDDKILKENCIIIDDAQPINVSKKISENRNDILIIEGGIANKSNIKYKLDLNFVDKGDIFSCLAEVMIFAMTKRGDLAVSGRTNRELVYKVGLLGDELGFKLGRFRSFGKLLNF